MFTLLENGEQFHFPSRYVIDGTVGSGKNGIVKKAWDTQTEQYVAIKKLKQPFENPSFARRTFRELALLNSINHQNVIKLLDVYTPQKNFDEFRDVYYVMEYMNTNLSSEISFSRQLDQSCCPNNKENLSFIMYQILCGVNHLQKCEIMHRDLCPENICYNGNVVKILGFGLACPQKSVALTRYVTGRPYRAPEILLGKNYDKRADIWSIGCIFAELIKKHVMFLGENPLNQWEKIIECLGTPNSSFFESVRNPSINAFVRSLPIFPSKAWENLFPDSLFCLHQTNSNARDLISRMLVIDPNYRISIQNALQHPYVRLWRKDEEVNAPAMLIYGANIDGVQHYVETWKQMIFQHIRGW
uniref:Protein kinase domain-containing protein n=1 Tax=Panagrolaimus sp. PS1159 TaxID=55785 RepID=A0AC35GCN0_9BILA